MKIKKISKSAKIRQLLMDNASLKPAEIAKRLKVNINLVYGVQFNMRKKRRAMSKAIKTLRRTTSALDALLPVKTNGNGNGNGHAVTPHVFEVEKIDHVNPSHYTHGGIDTWDFLDAKELNYRLSNVVKYVVRAPHKGEELTDLKKAQAYLNREIKRVESRVHG